MLRPTHEFQGQSCKLRLGDGSLQLHARAVPLVALSVPHHSRYRTARGVASGLDLPHTDERSITSVWQRAYRRPAAVAL
jgi:hypothetical protein